jgi:hypothetical protein
MSNTSQGPGWWMASDGKWYPPELWTGPPEANPAGPSPSAQSPSTQSSSTQYPSQPSAQPSYPAQGPAFGTGASGPSGPPAYGANPYANAGYSQYGPPGQNPYSQAVPRKNNGLAIASLVCSCAGIFLLGIPAVLGVIFGFVARRQIRQSNGAQGGGGMALAGIIVGFVVVGLVVLGLVVRATQHNQTTDIVGFVTGIGTGIITGLG